MTTHEEALRALAQAYDREDAAQRGEPDPWNLDDPGDIGDSDTWVSERLACAQVAAEAFLSALLPEDVAGLVERLRQYEGRQWETTACYNGTRDEAASLIQSLTARIAELERALTEISKQTYGTEISMDGDERAEILGRHLAMRRSIAFTALKKDTPND